MRIHRFFVSKIVGDNKHYTIAEESLVHQLRKVLRAKTGDMVTLFDGSGFEYVAELQALEKHEIVCLIHEKRVGLVPVRSISVCFSLIKKDNIEHILQKCTEMGVSEFYPVLSDRSEKKGINAERAQRIVLEAVEQSGWVTLPRIHEVSSLEEVIDFNKKAQNIVFHTVIQSINDEKSEKIAKQVPSDLKNIDSSKKIVVFVGPEGGWSDAEIELFKKKGLIFASLGQSILRAETATVAAVARLVS